MSALEKLVDKAIETCSPSNGAELARRLNVSRSSVSLWRQGRKIDPNHLTALIHIAGAEPAMAVEVLREQAATRPEREIWGQLARRLGAAAAVAAVALIALPLMAGSDGHYSAFLLALAVPERLAELCIMRSDVVAGAGALFVAARLLQLALSRLKERADDAPALLV